MKFSIIYEAQMVDTSRKNEARVFNEIIEQSLLAEQVGFDNVWAVEHTALTQYAHMSAPETFLAFLAGKTTRLGHDDHGWRVQFGKNIHTHLRQTEGREANDEQRGNQHQR